VRRRPDWEQRLHRFIEAAFSRPHAFGSWDCLLFAAGAVKAVIGKDHGRGHRRKYRNRAEAYRYLKSLGFESAEALIDSVLAEKPVGFPQRGDLVLTSGGIPGVVYGDVALCAGEAIAADGSVQQAGLIRVPRGEWLKAWAVGSMDDAAPQPDQPGGAG